jgi:uncharacterized cupredoxin-like copper-binding protein
LTHAERSGTLRTLERTWVKLPTSLFAVALAIGCVPVLAHLRHEKDAEDPRATEERPFGRQGDAKQVSRTVDVEMDDHLRYRPSKITVKQGETIRFRVRNSGRAMHEMVLGTMEELKAHARLMRHHGSMAHHEPYIAHVEPGKTGTMLWQFTQPGEFHYGCLVPGHLEAGMLGSIVVQTAK